MLPEKIPADFCFPFTTMIDEKIISNIVNMICITFRNMIKKIE